ncbi:hypothetical protein [Hyalangium rubrum]|uniref:Lipoprotein n=1 Tax=Hyalangium rubrum TaxID=3103134 RepID=A0ABU5HI59_9BACT|nr:hypothetical protein [Hyalangium sp. s54d21]MDY7231760.1 hypothetical protein [Hyalangium sp. s54d21]
MPKPDALAREIIDEALGLASWIIQDAKDGNIGASPGVVVRQSLLGIRHGTPDYRLPGRLPAHAEVEARSTKLLAPAASNRATHKASAQILSLLLCLLLVSCSTTPPSRAEEIDLAHTILLIRALPDGQFTHTWHRAEELNLPQCMRLPSSRATDRRIVLAMGPTRDCDAELQECMRECMDRPLPRGYGHITSQGRKGGGKEAYCNKKCLQPYLDCWKLQEMKPHEFTAVDDAVNWVKRNNKSILLGSVVVIGGVVFVVVSAGAGLLILAPAALLASSGAPTASCIVAVTP